METNDSIYAFASGSTVNRKVLNIEEVNYFLHQFRITPNYKGYHYFIEAYALAAEDPWRLTLITKLIYPEIAKKYKTSNEAVERDLRNIKNYMWRINKRLMCEICQTAFTKCPPVSSLLAALISSLYVFPKGRNIGDES